jgi:O-glycosyl hydrolase
MPIQITVNPSKTYQTMEGFGASGAWWAQGVGGWPEAERREVLRRLYDKAEGLGMGIYRYNLGSGSKESGKGHFPNKNRKTSEWHQDQEAIWCMREAVRLGADEIVLFVNSPPERFTRSGTAQGKLTALANLKRDCEGDFVNYVLDAAEHFIAEGLPVRFVSPVNEPFGPWIAKSGQEGCHYHPAGVRRLLRLFAGEMGKRPALEGVLLSGAENNDVRIMNKSYTRAVLGDPAIAKRLDGIDVHDYVFKPLRHLKGAKRRFRKYMDRRHSGAPVRMSEWTHMQGGRYYGMSSAREQAKIMWEDLAVMRVVSWQHWIAVAEVDFADGLLYIDEETHEISTPKRYWAFGNFSKFVPRGAVRVDVECPSPALKCLAFRTPEHIAVIVINPTGRGVRASLGGGKGEIFVTSEYKSLACREIDLAGFDIERESVNTILL